MNHVRGFSSSSNDCNDRSFDDGSADLRRGAVGRCTEARAPQTTAPDTGLRLLHVDEACIIVDKPAGRHSVPGRGELAEGSVAQQLQAWFADARIVHRLDMATSGALLFARGAAWQRHFSIEFAQRRIAKTYIAIVDGRLGSRSGDSGRIDLPLSADWPNRPRQRVDLAAGKPSTTGWQTLEIDADNNRTRLLLTPLTGRSHQLRVHLMAIGHPILGDTLYGRPQCRPANRLMLHASSIAFVHPVDGSALQVEALVPF